MATKFQLCADPIKPVGCHAWNKNRDQLAMSPNNNEVHILSFKGGKFTKLHVLVEHSERVTGIDWAPESNRIVTAAADRNAYVWNESGGKWSPTLVILRINRAATCCKWSPNEDKFAVGSGSRLISICYFEEENDWWVAKHIKKPIRSTILCLDWHPNNVLIAAGSSDFKTRVFSGYVKTQDAKPGPTVWGKKMPFGACMAEFGTGAQSGGWVHDVSFSEDGDKLAYVAHDSSITVVDGGTDGTITRVATADLPYRCVSWITSSALVVAGHSNVPIKFEYGSGSLKKVGPMDIPEVKKKVGMSAMDKFKSLDKKGTSDSASTETSLNTTHQNSIVQLSILGGTKDACEAFTTIGVDGKLVVWEVAKLKV